jgi:hypothetical protein
MPDSDMALPLPQRGGSIDQLRALVNLKDGTSSRHQSIPLTRAPRIGALVRWSCGTRAALLSQPRACAGSGAISKSSRAKPGPHSDRRTSPAPLSLRPRPWWRLAASILRACCLGGGFELGSGPRTVLETVLQEISGPLVHDPSAARGRAPWPLQRELCVELFEPPGRLRNSSRSTAAMDPRGPAEMGEESVGLNTAANLWLP